MKYGFESPVWPKSWLTGIYLLPVYVRFNPNKMLSLGLLQCEHGTQVTRAGHTESKLNMRLSVLDLSATRNAILVACLKKSRLSVPYLFGSLQENVHRDMELDSHNGGTKFLVLQISETKNVTQPASRLGKKCSASQRRTQSFRGVRRGRVSRGSTSGSYRQQQFQFANYRPQRHPYPQPQAQQRGGGQQQGRGRGRRGSRRNRNRGSTSNKDAPDKKVGVCQQA